MTTPNFEELALQRKRGANGKSNNIFKGFGKNNTVFEKNSNYIPIAMLMEEDEFKEFQYMSESDIVSIIKKTKIYTFKNNNKTYINLTQLKERLPVFQDHAAQLFEQSKERRSIAQKANNIIKNCFLEVFFNKFSIEHLKKQNLSLLKDINVKKLDSTMDLLYEVTIAYNKNLGLNLQRPNHVGLAEVAFKIFKLKPNSGNKMKILDELTIEKQKYEKLKESLNGVSVFDDPHQGFPQDFDLVSDIENNIDEQEIV